MDDSDRGASEFEEAMGEVERVGVGRYADEAVWRVAGLLERKAYYCSKRYSRDEKLAGELWEAAYELRRLSAVLRAVRARNGCPAPVSGREV